MPIENPVEREKLMEGERGGKDSLIRSCKDWCPYRCQLTGVGEL